jgi:hypothetical protein
LNVEEYLKSLPRNILNGEDVNLSEKSYKSIFNLADLKQDDIFYHLGCGDGLGIKIAIRDYHVKKAIGIDYNIEKINQARSNLAEENISAEILFEDIFNSDISDATVILFWFTNEQIIEEMKKKFSNLKEGTRIITIWGPLPETLPDKVEFPYIINQTPFRKAQNIQEQLLSIFKVKCVDFVTAWEFAERYTKALGTPDIKNDRFLTIIQTLVIWINAKKLGVTCGEEIPESINTYIKLMKMNFDIDFEPMLNDEM